MGRRLANTIDLVGEVIDTFAECFPSCDRVTLQNIEAEFRHRYGGAEVYIRRARPREPLEVERIRPDVPLAAQERELGYSRHSLYRALRARKQRGGSF